MLSHEKRNHANAGSGQGETGNQGNNARLASKEHWQFLLSTILPVSVSHNRISRSQQQYTTPAIPFGACLSFQFLPFLML